MLLVFLSVLVGFGNSLGGTGGQDFEGGGGGLFSEELLHALFEVIDFYGGVTGDDEVLAPGGEDPDVF